MTLPQVSFLRYLRVHPFSVMALCNIVGDTCYLGFAFSAEGFVSIPKLIGALFCLCAHTMLLAFGDDRARVIAAEKGRVSTVLLSLRHQAQRLTSILPNRWAETVRRFPVGVSFTMLSLNGFAFVVDGLIRLHHQWSIAMLDQTIMGGFIVLGLVALATADFIKSQRLADILTKSASFLLGTASLLNFILGVTTLNGFVIVSIFAFAISNLTVYFARLDKQKYPEESII